MAKYQKWWIGAAVLVCVGSIAFIAVLRSTHRTTVPSNKTPAERLRDDALPRHAIARAPDQPPDIKASGTLISRSADSRPADVTADPDQQTTRTYDKEDTHALCDALRSAIAENRKTAKFRIMNEISHLWTEHPPDMAFISGQIRDQSAPPGYRIFLIHSLLNLSSRQPLNEAQNAAEVDALSQVAGDSAEDTNVRTEAVTTLGRLCKDDDVVNLAESLLDSQDPHLVAAALDCISSVGTDKSREVFQRILDTRFNRLLEENPKALLTVIGPLAAEQDKAVIPKIAQVAKRMDNAQSFAFTVGLFRQYGRSDEVVAALHDLQGWNKSQNTTFSEDGAIIIDGLLRRQEEMGSSVSASPLQPGD